MSKPRVVGHRTEIRYRSIGIVHTPFTERAGTPIQPTGAEGIEGTIEIFEEYAPGLQDLQGFSHIILLYHFDRSTTSQLRVTPFLDCEPRGIFATRAPCRPNPIGLSIVRLLHVEGAVVHVANVDMLDGTPLLDIKPYIPEFDERPGARVGWLEDAAGRVRDVRADDRFR